MHARKAWLISACLAAVLAKLALCMGMPLDVHANAAYDDAWAVRAADFLSQGQWLGPYDDITLIKNIGFPLWLAACHAMGIGYLTGTAALYVLASAAFTVAVRPLVRRDWLCVVLFVLVLFCPMSFATDTYQRVYRNSITAAQALFVFSAYLGCYIRVWGATRDASLRGRTLVPWALIGAVVLPWFWLSREDSIWIAPFVVVATVVPLAMLVKAAWRSKKATAPVSAYSVLLCALLVCVPLAATAVSVNAVKAMNESHYGVAVTAEINSGNFARMVKALYAIDPAQVKSAAGAAGGMPQNQRVAVTHAALEAACGESSVLQSVHSQVEEAFSWGDTIDNDQGDGEVNGGEFFWIMRRAARDAGAYGSDGAARRNLAKAMASAVGEGDAAQGASAEELLALSPAQFADRFYGCIADELEVALAEGELPRRATMPSSIMTPWRAEYAPQLLPTAWNIAQEAFGCGDVTALPFAAQGSEDGIEYFERMTGDTAYRAGDPVPAACTIGEAIIWFYRFAGCALGILGLAGTLVIVERMVVSWRRSKKTLASSTDFRNAALLVVLLALFFGAFTLVAGLTYSRVSSFIPISYYYYGSAAYPLLLAFGCLGACALVDVWSRSKAEEQQ